MREESSIQETLSEHTTKRKTIENIKEKSRDIRDTPRSSNTHLKLPVKVTECIRGNNKKGIY